MRACGRKWALDMENRGIKKEEPMHVECIGCIMKKKKVNVS